MDLKINRETVSATETIYEGVQEQGIELDYILPDYYPDIFRIVRCESNPVITDYNVNGNKLSYELRCDIKILYCSENGSVLQCVNQQQTFTKTIELNENCDSPTVSLKAKSEHINYRAVNKRRFDMRGAVSVKIKVEGRKNQDIICDVSGLNVQLKKIPVCFASEKITAEKTLQLVEETELSATHPPIIDIVSCRCMPTECEKKMISGKLLAKGDTEIKLLYSCEKDGEGSLESLDFSLPYSQIVDVDGIDDSYECTITAETVSCEITPSADKSGENRIIKCEIELRLICCAIKSTSITIGTDAYSTIHPCEIGFSEIKAEQIPVIFTENFRHTAKLSDGDNIPHTVYSIWCNPKNINSHRSEDGKKITISGMLNYTIAAKDSAGMIVMPDKDETFEETIELDGEQNGSYITADIYVNGVTYNISNDGVLIAKADITAKVFIYKASSVTALTHITVDESTKKERDGDYAIKLYYGTENEEIWDIAKRYSTCVDAIIEENELSADRLDNGGMLLIPIVS